MSEHNIHILSGTVARKSLTPTLQNRVLAYGGVIHLVIISIGTDSASQVYIQNKKTYGELLGVRVTVHAISEQSSQEEIISIIEKYNNDERVHGIIVQSPIPSHLSFDSIVSHVSPGKDVDGLTPGTHYIPATARGIESLLRYYQIDVSGKHAVVLGRSKLVGLPTVHMLLRNNATVTVCHSKTSGIPHITKQADILVVAIGKPQYVSREYVSKGQVVIDVGIHRSTAGLVGDVDFHDVKDLVSAITPVPGGVGPMTVYSLFENCIEAAEKQSVRN